MDSMQTKQPSSRKIKIDNIIKARQNRGTAFEQYTRWLTNVGDLLTRCKIQLEKAEISGRLAPGQQEAFFNAIKNISGRIFDCKQQLEKVRLRFSCGSITIVVAGAARIGKSTFLQSLTGLTDNQIPTGIAGACTSTQSIITHSDSDKEKAIVYYYEKESFLNNIIKEMYKKLHWDTNAFTTVEGFKADFPLHEKPQNAGDIAIYENLMQIYKNIDEICSTVFDEFKTQETVEDLNTIKDFVTYRVDEMERVVPRKAANLAVRKVEIFCKFPVADVGQISIIDTPGMDTDTEVRDKEILRDVLNNSADFVLLFSAPRSGGLTGVDTRLLEECQKCMPLLPGDSFKDRAFFIANQGKFLDESGNIYLDSTNPSFNGLLERAYNDGKIQAHKYIRVDARNPEQVQTNVLDPLLDHLSEAFEKFDENQEKAAKDILRDIGRETETLLANIVDGLGIMRTADPGNYKQFQIVFDSLLAQLSSHLSKALDDMMPSRTIGTEAYSETAMSSMQSNIFTETLKQIVKNYRETPPEFLTTAAIQQEIYANPGQGGAAFFNLMSHLRCHIIGLFAAMDDNCHQIVEDAKTKLENVFRNSNGGCLERVSELEDKHGSEFFAVLAQFARTHEAPILAEQLEAYAKFKLSFSGFMAHKVSANLDSVRMNGYAKVFSEPIDFSKPENILEALIRLGESAVNDIAVEFAASLSTEPGEAVFAMSENFVDITLRTKSVKNDWFNLYAALKNDIWPEIFDPEHSANRSMIQLKESLANLKNLMAVLKKIIA